MKKFLLLALACGFLGIVPNGSQAAAVTDLDTALSSLTGDLGLVGGWVNKQLEKSTALAAGATVIRPAAVKTLPGFEIGVTAGVTSGIDTNNPISKLATYGISSDFLQLPPFFSNPVAMLHAKVGLISLPGLGKIDVGGGLGNGEINMANDLYGKLSQWQLEARIQPDWPLPFDSSFTLGVGNAKGTYTVSKTHEEEVLGIEYNGNRYTQNLSTRVFMSSDWDVNAYYARLMISKTLLFLTPYAGLGIQTATGRVNTLVGSEGTLTLDPDLAGPNVSRTARLVNTTTGAPRNFTWLVTAGVQLAFLPFMNMTLSAEYGDQVFGGSLGLIVSVL